ncbi:MAG TPA: tetratricopeptide repeat protein, partial [Bacteroidales bacterium]|nr:tetratricopeptide repeat protein [Bacteroidales bacterium]
MVLHKLKLRHIIFFTGILLLLFACSTKKNTAVNRFYHNLTSHYNAYFNGRDNYKVAIKNFEKSYNDDYTKILPVFKYTDNQTASSLSGAMDIVIEKATKVIKFHSITAKPKRKSGHLSKKQKAFYKKNEYNNWVDDSWLLIGKAKFYKTDYMGALQAFKYIISEYGYDEIRFETGLWKARAEIQMKQYDDALTSLQLIDGDKDFPKKLKSELYAVYADLYLKQKKYNDAVNMLNKAIKYKPKKNNRVRYQFILAQIYEHLHQYENATNLYAIVAKSNPPYEMAFASMISRATSYIDKTGNPQPIIKQLHKMLKDDKNNDYQDQIYYALASVYLKTGNEPMALENLKHSVESGGGNTQQKAKTYLLIADIYFNRKAYALSQPYYDSTMMYLDRDYENYKQLKNKTDNLTELVKNINTVQLQDSLQMLARLSAKERMAIINDIIKAVKKKKEEERLAEVEQQQYYYQNNNLQMQQYQQGLQQNQGGKWYFYNPAMLSMGQAEFKQKWGNRKLEDNWRRKNKIVVSFDMENESEELEVDSAGQVVKIDNENPQYYLRKIPLTDSMMTASNKMIKEALYNLGILYRERFNNYQEAVKAFETLIARFSETDNKFAVYYNLYQIYKLEKNKEQEEKYKNLILSEFPDSEMAKSISDPDYNKKKEAKLNHIKELYVQTYLSFSNGNTQLANQMIREYEQMNNSFLQSKFLLLKALNQAKRRDYNAMKQIFIQIGKEFPNSP